MKRNKSLIVIAILFMAIGFAAVATNLVINGNILVGTNQEDFDVIFTRSVIDGINRSVETISEDGKSITFNTRDLSTLGDKSILDFEVTNKSTQYDANVTMECVGGSNESEYYTITKNFPSLVGAQSRVNGKVEVELKKVTTEAISETFTCTIKVNAVERIDKPVDLKACNVVQGDGTNVGDKINCGSESFYVIKNDGTNIRMLAEYNLLVGDSATYDEGNWIVVPLSTPTGLQDSKAVGGIWKDGSWYSVKTRYGTTPFSNIDSTYVGSIIENYVEEYKIRLAEKGIDVQEATLITKEELNELGMEDNKNIILPGREWIYQTSYWTRTALDSSQVWYINYNGGLRSEPYTFNHGYGVRPVISIPVDQI